MKRYRHFFVVTVAISTLCLCGYKKHSKPPKHHRQKTVIAEQALPKPSLDLTMPEKAVIFQSGLDLKMVHPSEGSAAQFFNPQHSKPNPLEMKGQVIMSQEPEAEKRKSADGAGIMINLRH